MHDIINDIMYDIQVQGRKTYAGTANSAAYHHITGKDSPMEFLDVHLLKPARLICHSRSTRWGGARMAAEFEQIEPPAILWYDIVYDITSIIISYVYMKSYMILLYDIKLHNKFMSYLTFFWHILWYMISYWYTMISYT